MTAPDAGHVVPGKHNPGGRGAEAFIATGLLSLGTAAAWAVARPGLLHGPFHRPEVLALTHLVTLGWVSSAAIGVFLRLAPPILGTRPLGGRAGSALYLLWLAGFTGLALHMLQGMWFGVWTAALLLVLTVLLLALLHREVFARARRGNLIAAYAAAALVNLLLAAVAGTLLGLARSRGWFPVPPLAGVALHFTLAEAGWLTVLILGFGRKLLPPLSPPRSREPWESRIRLGLLVAGTWATGATVVVAPRLTGGAAALLAVAVLLHVARPLARFLTGRVRDRASRWASAALLFLALDTLLGTVLALGIIPLGTALRSRALFAFGFTALAGWNTLAVTAFALKIVPMWVWQERFLKELGRRPVPAMMDLYSHRLQHLTGWALTAGTALTAGGMLAGRNAAIDWGMRAVALGVAAFLVNFALTLRWRSPRTAFRPTEEDWEAFRAAWGDGAAPAGKPTGGDTP